MYTHLFIDFDDTLWDFKRNAYVALKVCYEQLDIARYYPSYPPFYQAYEETNAMLWGKYHHALITRDELMEQRFKMPLAQIGVTDSKLVEELNQSYLATLMQQTILLPHAIETLAYLHAKYPLYIISNGFKEVQDTKMRRSGVMPYIQKVFLSDNIGYTKPNPKIFEYVLQATGAKANQSIMIGDNYDADIVGAMNSGIDQIYFNPNGHPIVGEKPTYQIASLAEIAEIL